MPQPFGTAPPWLQELRRAAQQIEGQLSPAERQRAENGPEPAADELDVLLQEAAMLLDGAPMEGETCPLNRETNQYSDELLVQAAAAPGGPEPRGAVEWQTVRGRYRVTVHPAADGTERWLLVVQDTVARAGRVVVWDQDGVLLRATLHDGVASGRINRPIADLSQVRFRTETPAE